jgi:acetoacetyl-CoA synthetase
VFTTPCPDEIVRVDKIPYTLTGKKMEVPVRNIMKGFTMAEVVDLESLKEKGSLDEYLTYARSK